MKETYFCVDQKEKHAPLVGDWKVWESLLPFFVAQTVTDVSVKVWSGSVCVFDPSWALVFQETSNLTFQEGICQNMRKEEKQIDSEENEFAACFALQHIL